MTQLLVLLDQPFHRKKTTNFELLFFGLVLLPGTCTGFSERNFSRSHAHFDCSFFFFFFAEDFLCFRLGVIRKCTIFALLQRMIFSHCTCTFGFFFSPIFLGTFPTFQQTTLLLFLRDFWFAEPFRRFALKNGDECTQVAKFRFDKRPHDSF